MMSSETLYLPNINLSQTENSDNDIMRTKLVRLYISYMPYKINEVYFLRQNSNWIEK